MELKSLILGLVFSTGIFAVKSGAGLAYLFKRERKPFRRLGIVCGFAASYALVFWLAWFLIDRIDFIAFPETTMRFFQNGMAIHFMLAALLLVWGVVLLKKSGGCEHNSRGWMLLSLPCPVCFAVILFSAAFLRRLLPDTPWAFVCLGAGFITMSLISGAGLAFFNRGDPEQGLGAVMVLAALYFLITIAVAPQFADIERIYRISKSSGTAMPDKRLLLLLMGLAPAFAAGFIQAVRKTLWK